ncbi:MAG: hypothetical protein ACON38_17545 [Akkermansiaceae bacterium]
MWRLSRIKRDREAGLAFDWRSGHGSTTRMIIALAVTISFFGGLWAFVQLREVKPSPLKDQQIDLTMIDLNLESNRWFADLLERETLFHDRWDVSSTAALDREVTRALAADPIRIYEPTLEEIVPPERDLTLENLPGMGPMILPPPEEVPLVEFAVPPVNWWIEVESVEGDEDWEGFSFEWPGAKDQMSEGEVWSLLVGVDWEGRVLTCTAWEEATDPRTPMVKDYCFNATFPSLEERGPLRWWKLQAKVVNRLVE